MPIKAVYPPHHPGYCTGHGIPQGSGFVWDAVGDSDPSNRHAVCTVGYDEHGVIIDIRRLRGWLTDAAAAKYAFRAAGGQLYAVLRDQRARGEQRARNSIAWNGTIADFDAPRGNIPAEMSAMHRADRGRDPVTVAKSVSGAAFP